MVDSAHISHYTNFGIIVSIQTYSNNGNVHDGWLSLLFLFEDTKSWQNNVEWRKLNHNFTLFFSSNAQKCTPWEREKLESSYSSVCKQDVTIIITSVSFLARNCCF